MDYTYVKLITGHYYIIIGAKNPDNWIDEIISMQNKMEYNELFFYSLFQNCNNYMIKHNYTI